MVFTPTNYRWRGWLHWYCNTTILEMHTTSFFAVLVRCIILIQTISRCFDCNGELQETAISNLSTNLGEDQRPAAEHHQQDHRSIRPIRLPCSIRRPTFFYSISHVDCLILYRPSDNRLSRRRKAIGTFDVK